MVTLTKEQWTRLYKEVSGFAQASTFTKDKKQQWTSRDRAQEAVQKACLRLLETKPADVKTYEDARDYLFGAIRSSLYNAREERVTRKAVEKEVMAEEVHLGRWTTPSAETMQLEKGEQGRSHRRAARIVELTREELKGDAIALGTMDCIAEDIDKPADQAKKLGCDVREVYKARFRRKTALDRAIARYEQERHAPESEETA
ncbi:MAG TPA: hypothetical protein VF765_33875 [Polyangiaceae bacterium]